MEAALLEPYIEDEIVNRAFFKGLKPTPNLSLSEWADENFWLPKEGNVEPGKFRSSRTPYLKEIMDNLSPHSPVEYTIVIKGTQLGFTTVGLVWFAYTVDIDPASMMMLMPTLNTARRHSKKKVKPTIETNPCLRGKIKEARSRDSGNTMMLKEFPGGDLTIAGANSGADMRNLSVQKQIQDELDGYPLDVDDEGDPSDLSENRSDAYGERAKFYKLSTPKIKQTSLITREFEDSDQRHYHVPCPFCGYKQILRWEYFRFTYQEKTYQLMSEVTFQCISCNEEIHEHYKTFMLENGEWVPHNPGNERRGYHLSSFYSPLGWLSWKKIVKQFLKARKEQKKGNNGPMKRWINTRLAEAWDEGEDAAGEVNPYGRREVYGPRVPMAAGFLTCIVDVQKDRLEAEVTAWGPGEESWKMEHKIIYGDPQQKHHQCWAELDEYIGRTWTHESGAKIKVDITLVDSGAFTENVYHFVRPRQSRRVYAIKGAKEHDSPLVSRGTWNKLMKIRLFHIGGNVAKDVLYARLQIEDPGPGYIHFPMSYDEEYFRQLTSEKVVHDKKGRRLYEKHGKNEAVDLNVYALAALAMRSPNLARIAAKFQKQGEKMQEEEKRENEVVPVTQPKINRLTGWPRRRGGWISRWKQ